MPAIKPSTATPSPTDIPRRSRAHSHSSLTLLNQQQHSTSSSPSPPITSFSPPSLSALPIAPTHPHDTTATTTNENDTTITSQVPSLNTRRSNNDTHHHHPRHPGKQDHRGRLSKNNTNQIHTHHSSHHRHNHHHRSTSIVSSNNNSNNNSNSSYSRRTHVRRHSASAYYAGPVDHDRVIHTANAYAQAAASGILSPRLRNSRLLLSPKGPQPQRHLLRQQRQQQQQLRRYQQQQLLLRPPLFDLPPQFHHRQQEQEQQEQEQEEQQQHHTSRRGSSYSILLPSISPSSSVSVVSPLVLHRSSSMPLVHTRPLERRDQEEAAAVASTLRRTQPHPFQPPFYRLLQQPPQSRRKQQQRHQNLESESDHDQDKPLDESPPDPRLISQRLLQWQEHQEHKKRQEEQRQMQAFRIKKFSDSNTDLDYRPLATTVFKEGFQEHWGDPIVEHQREEAWEEEEDGQQQNSRRSSIQEDDHDIDVAGSSDEHNNNNFWKEQRQRQRQLAQEQDGMEADSVMDMDKTGDGEGDGDEEMDPYTRLQRARKVKEDAMKDYQKAGRNLQRAQEREEAIMFEYETELIEVGVGSSVSQQSNRHHGHGHELGHHQQRLSPPLVQLQQQQQQMEERGRYSPSTTTAAAAFQVQDDNNNEAMANSQIVPQVGNTPSVMSETPHAVMAPASLLPVSTPSGSDPRRVLSPMTTITTATENQVSNQTRSGSQAQSQSQSVPRNETQLPPTFLHLRHHSGSPRVKIKSEELDEPIFKKHALDGGGGITGPDDDSKRRRGPKYKDYDITIVIPSSVGSSDIGMSGQPESSNAQERREQAEMLGRRLPDKWRSPTPMPRSMHARREATRRPQEMSWESIRPPLAFGPGGSGTAKVAPVDLFGGRGGSSQQQQHRRQHGPSSFQPVLLSPRSSAPRLRPYPLPFISQARRASQVQGQVPVGVGLPLNFFAHGMPTRPAQPSSSSSSSQQQQRGQGHGQGRSSPLVTPSINQAASAAATAFTAAAASAFTGPAAPTPRYINSHPHPHPHPHPQGSSTWRLPEFMDENGHPYSTVVFYTHIDRVDHFYHQHYPATSTTSTASRSRDVPVPSRSAQTSPNFFARRSGEGGERMEDVRDGGEEGYEDMAMDGEHHHQLQQQEQQQQQQRQGRSRTSSRTTSRQADRDQRQEDRRERKPRAKSESLQL